MSGYDIKSLLTLGRIRGMLGDGFENCSLSHSDMEAAIEHLEGRKTEIDVMLNILRGWSQRSLARELGLSLRAARDAFGEDFEDGSE